MGTASDPRKQTLKTRFWRWITQWSEGPRDITAGGNWAENPWLAMASQELGISPGFRGKQKVRH